MKDESIKCTFMSMANHSINEVLMRSMNTSITSLIPVVAMLLFGGETLKDFALAMTIGLVAGAYSSYAIATPLYAVWKTTEERFARLRKKHGDEVQRFVLNRLPEEAAKIAAAVNVAAPAAATEGAPVSGAVATEAAGTAGSDAPSKRAGSKKASSGKTSSSKGASRTSNHHYRRKGR